MENTLIIVGIIFIVFGLFAGVHTTSTTESFLGGLFTNEELERPYQMYSIPLIVGGIVLILIGALQNKNRISRKK